MKVQLFMEAGMSPPDLVELGRLASHYGVQTLWASSFPARREPFMCLTPLASVPGAMRIGPVPISPFELHPLRIADSLLTLNELSKGRASITIGGLGHSVERVIDVRPARRVTAVRECVEIIKAAATGEFVNYRGELYSLMNYHADWLESSPPLVYVGANGPQMLKMAGRVADGVMLSDVPLARMAEVLGHMRDGRASADRRDAIRVANFFAWHIKEDEAAANAEARMEMIWRGLLQPWHTEPFLGAKDAAFIDGKRDAFLRAFLARAPEIEGVPEHLVQSLVDNLTFTGGPGAIDGAAERLHALGEAGVDEATLKIHGDPGEALRLIGERLLPALS